MKNKDALIRKRKGIKLRAFLKDIYLAEALTRTTCMEEVLGISV